MGQVASFGELIMCVLSDSFVIWFRSVALRHVMISGGLPLASHVTLIESDSLTVVDSAVKFVIVGTANQAL